MVDYPGEQNLWDIYETTGSVDYYALWDPLNPGSGGTATLTSGDGFICNAAASQLLPTDVLGGAFWVIELSVGGTFQIRIGFDTGYSYDSGSITWSTQTMTLEAGRHAFPLPSDQLEYAKIVGDSGVPTLAVSVTGGSPVMGGAYLQTEGPGGYQVAVSSAWSDLRTPAERQAPIRASYTRETRHASLDGGYYFNPEDIPGSDYKSLVWDAFESCKAGSGIITTDTAAGGVLFADSLVYPDNELNVVYPSTTPYQPVGSFGLASNSVSLEWYTDATDIYQPMPTAVALMQYGRDYTDWEYVSYGGTNAVSWNTGYLVPTAQYSYVDSVEGPIDVYPSPFGDAITVDITDESGTSTVTVLGSSGPLNPTVDAVDDGPVSGAVPYTPPPGPVTFIVTPLILDVSELPDPRGGYPITDNGAYLALRWLLTADHTHWPYQGSPTVTVVDPQYRIMVPVFQRSSESFGGGYDSGGGTGWDNTWGDWSVPGWGSWDWFPDYGWGDTDYPDYPDYNDYYVPIETLPTYHYLPFDLNTNTQLGEIPLQDVSYSHKLSAPGSANFSIPVTPEMLKQQIKQSSVPGKTGIYIIRDSQIVWGGIIWKRQYDSKNRQVRFEAGSFESYFDHRFQSNVLGFEDVDQLTIARTLALQAADEMHIDVDTATSGVNRYYNAFYYDFKTIGGEIDSLASLWDGFDWNIRVYLDVDGVVRRRLVWGYPNLGVSAADTDLLFEYPGAIRSYSITEDADKAGNRLWAIGGGQGLDQIQYEAIDMAQLDAGWPLLETTTSYKDVFDPPRLEARSKQDLARLRPPVTVLNVEVDPFSHPKLGTYTPGDWARFVIQDNWNNPGIDIKRRIVGYSVSVSASSPLDRVSLDIDAGDTT